MRNVIIEKIIEQNHELINSIINNKYPNLSKNEKEDIFQVVTIAIYKGIIRRKISYFRRVEKYVLNKNNYLIEYIYCEADKYLKKFYGNIAVDIFQIKNI